MHHDTVPVLYDVGTKQNHSKIKEEKMKVKEVVYLRTCDLESLKHKVNKMLGEGWNINGTVVKDNEDDYVQMMFLPEKITELKTVVSGVSGDADAEFSKMFAEGYTLYGTPFTVDNRICQSMVKGE